MKDQQMKERFIELRAQGLSFDRIAKEIEVSRRTLLNWNNEFHYEIAQLKAIELEALMEKYFLRTQKKLELFGERLLTIKEELSKRDLTDVPTDKLFDLLVRLVDRLDKEEIKPRFLSDSDIAAEKESAKRHAELFGGLFT